VSSPEEAFAKLLGQQPTDKDRQRLYRVRDAIGIKNTDSLWVLMIALQYYETLYERIPQKIVAAAAEAVAAARKTAESQAKAAAAEAHRGLTSGVLRAVNEIARRGALRDILKWAAVTVFTSSVMLVTVGRWEFHRGESEGEWRIEKVAREERARKAAESSWASTPDGRAAFELARAGVLHDILTCSGRGLVPREGWCVAQGERGRPFHWRTPETQDSR
jgi:hypothetical protein